MKAEPEVLVQMTHAGLDDDNGEIILRGVLVPSTLAALKVDTYQREILPIAKLLELTEAFQHGSVPDIDLGMRGGNYTERDGLYTLRDPVYIVDGLQRRTAALEVMKSNVTPRLGAVVHFNTTMEWERRRFRILNVARTRLSPNVLLRNMYLEGSPSLGILYGLTLDNSFPLCRKVNWDQRSHKEHLMSALTFLKSATALHSAHQGGFMETNHGRLVEVFDQFVNKIGHSLVRSNVMLFWNIVEECWGVRGIQVKHMAAHTKSAFLTALGQLFAKHEDFWADMRFIMPREIRGKLAKFNVTSREILALCGTGSVGTGRRYLYHLLLDHVNSGKRSKRLTPKEAVDQETETVDMRFLNKMSTPHRINPERDIPN